MAAQIKRNLEANGIYINSWQIGLYDNGRSPIFVPISAMGLQMIHRMDALWNGQNIDVSHNMTLQRRAGFTRFCSTAFGSSNYPLGFYSFKNTSGTLKSLVDTPTAIYSFTSSTLTSAISKVSTSQASMQKVGNTLYVCDGNDSDTKKWDGTTATKWGIVAPATAPTLGFVSGTLNVIKGYKYIYVFKNSSTGHISSASPVSADTFAQTGKNITVQGAGSTDTQVDKVDIYRTTDGGSVYYYLATVNNTDPWSYTDNSVDTSLNTFLVAPITKQNDPPPSGIRLVCFYLGRMWVATGNKLYFGGGPDITNGVPEECFPPANVFVLPGKITALAPTSQGLAVFTDDDAYVILGSDITSFTPKLWQKNFGVTTQNCIAQDGDLLFVYTSNRQLFQFSGSLNEIGFPIQTRLAAFAPSSTYLALHRNGADEGLFVSNGSDTVYRYSVAMGCWSTPYSIVGGVRAIASVETSTNTYQLLLGRTAGSGYILNRDTTTFQDDGSSYTANVTIGSLVLAPPRQVAIVNSVLLEVPNVGTYPTLSVLTNEISGSFTTLPNPVPDPPELAGTVWESSTVLMKRHDFKAAQAPLPQHVRHMQIQISWAAENAKNELLGLGVV